ncbi:MAG: FkbM family methyltransferase [Acetobacteraceae bacterium]|nr:FkbM family methyltransferase [Acetobacteraceae bacterium]
MDYAHATRSSLHDVLGRYTAGPGEGQLALDGALRHGHRVWLFGAGAFGRGAARSLQTRGLNVAGFVDAKKHGGEVDGLPVISSNDGRLASDDLGVIAVFNPHHSWGEVITAARHAGIARIATPVDLVDFAPETGSFWLVPRERLRAEMPRLLALRDRLADDVSRAVLEGVLAFRLTGDPALHPAVTADDQYFPRDLRGAGLALDGLVTFLDGGAFTGDTAEFLLRSGVALREWAAFEPDFGNFARLAARAARLPVGRATLFPLGLSDREEELLFDSRGDAASSVGSGSDRIRTVALDHVLPGFRPDYVKLDVEGAERAALRGMARTLAETRPRVAASCYHKPLDLADLCDELSALLPGARLYLRQHAESAFDTVMYAIP